MSAQTLSGACLARSLETRRLNDARRRKAARLAALASWFREGYKLGDPADLERDKLEFCGGEPRGLRTVLVGYQWAVVDMRRERIWVTRLTKRGPKAVEPAWARLLENVEEG